MKFPKELKYANSLSGFWTTNQTALQDDLAAVMR